MPCPLELTALLHEHLDEHGTTPGGHLFRGARGGPISERREWSVDTGPVRSGRDRTSRTGPTVVFAGGGPVWAGVAGLGFEPR